MQGKALRQVGVVSVPHCVVNLQSQGIMMIAHFPPSEDAIMILLLLLVLLLLLLQKSHS